MKSDKHFIDVQGHRGCRGLLPENTIPAFEKAARLGVTTLELDVVVSADHQIIVSHEPFFNHEISTAPDNQEILKETEHAYSIYQMNYDQIKLFDVGVKPHPRFLSQIKIASHKPTLQDMVSYIEGLAPSIKYNIELKRKPEWEPLYLPDLDSFVDLFLRTIKSLNIEDRVSIQSFDLECLRNLKSKTNIPLVLLVENLLPIDNNISSLGFKPDIYSPYFKLVDHRMVDYCNKHQIKLIPWTANTEEEINKLLDLKVDGIISDYPDLLINLINNRTDIDQL